MNCGIGIDTGGTFTDSVVVDLDSKRVLSKAKALTTRRDLRIGIENSLKGLDASLFPDVKLVSLSTTLATNSVVEGKGSRVGLIMAVPNPATFRVPPNMPAEEIAVVAGAHDKFGEAPVELDEGAVARALERMAHKVDAVAVSCFFSIYNARHELRIKELAAATGHPVVCGHELSGEAGLIERAVTAALNGRLLPVIAELLDAVKHILEINGIRAPVMVVKGDGSLIRESAARDKPVETVLSGPAASVVGASWLSGLADAVVADMGGTTTDIGIISRGAARTDKNGALVGGWQTRVKSIDMWTVGLGGDSKITAVSADDIRIGPRRAVPLCLAATEFSGVKEAVKKLSEARGSQLKGIQMDLFTLVKRPKYRLPKYEAALLDALDKRVLHRKDIEAEVGPFVDVDRFVSLGFAAEVAFTPTDLLHVLGNLDLWDKSVSDEAVGFLMNKTQLDREAVLRRLLERILEELEVNILSKTLLERVDGATGWSAEQTKFLRHLMKLNGSGGVKAELKCVRPIVAVGAPVSAYFPAVARALHTRLVIPEHAEVANAVGAVTGRVLAMAQVHVRPDKPKGFLVITAGEHKRFKSLEDAVAFAEKCAAEAAAETARRNGTNDPEISLSREEITAPLASGWGDRIILEFKITAAAAGRPYI